MPEDELRLVLGIKAEGTKKQIKDYSERIPEASAAGRFDRDACYLAT